jgi:hypothetical protein
LSLLAFEPVDLLKEILRLVKALLPAPLETPSDQAAVAIRNLLTQAMFNFRLLFEQGRLPSQALEYRLSLWVRPARKDLGSTKSLSADDYDFDAHVAGRKGVKRLLANQFVHLNYFALRPNRAANDFHVLVTSRKEAQYLFEAPLSQILDFLELATAGQVGESKPVELVERLTTK